MQVQENFSLRPYNSFGIDARTAWFASFSNVTQLTGLLNAIPMVNNARVPLLLLGGGSNILFTKDFEGLVLKNEIKGIEKVNEDEQSIFIKAGAGENWHQFVMHCVKNDWAGIENLSLIPGCVGASPMQNIGAYGVEIKDVFHELTAFHLQEKCNYTFSLKDCNFGYRESVFKNKYKDQFAILTVTYKLNKKAILNTSYGAIEQELERMGVKQTDIRTVSQAVINIRTSKLPAPEQIGNAGSFFKNPSVSKEKFLSLKNQYDNIVGYENEDGTVKLAAGWLIEQCGWKGYREDNIGVHEKQALVLVNYGDGKGEDIYRLSERIQQSIDEKFGVKLEREVNIV